MNACSLVARLVEWLGCSGENPDDSVFAELAMLDPMTGLAYSVYSGKGVYALLLGSGISRSSGIPTGWEIVLDLIRKVAALKKSIPDKRMVIRLHDLVTGELEKACQRLFPPEAPQRRARTLKEYESALEILLPLMIAAGSWGQPRHRWLWLRCFERLLYPSNGSPREHQIGADCYPAFLLLHAFGIASIAAKRTRNLAYIFAKSRTRYEDKEFPIHYVLVQQLLSGVLDELAKAASPDLAGTKVSSSRYIQSRLREPFRAWIPEDGRYKECFDQFEYLLGLSLCPIYKKKAGRCGAISGLYLLNSSLPQHFDEEIARQKERWPLLRAGLFNGSLEELKGCKAEFDLERNTVGHQLRML